MSLNGFHSHHGTAERKRRPVPGRRFHQSNRATIEAALDSPMSHRPSCNVKDARQRSESLQPVHEPIGHAHQKIARSGGAHHVDQAILCNARKVLGIAARIVDAA